MAVAPVPAYSVSNFGCEARPVANGHPAARKLSAHACLPAVRLSSGRIRPTNRGCLGHHQMCRSLRNAPPATGWQGSRLAVDQSGPARMHHHGRPTRSRTAPPAAAAAAELRRRDGWPLDEPGGRDHV
jgi:hypothetical protein